MTEPHIAKAFDRDLEEVQGLIMKMGGLVEVAILDASKAISTRDEKSPTGFSAATRPSTGWKSW